MEKLLLEVMVINMQLNYGNINSKNFEKKMGKKTEYQKKTNIIL